MIDSGPTQQHFSEPTKELDAAMRSRRIAHDCNPVLEWCISNVVGRYDVRSSEYPRKARPEQTIDEQPSNLPAYSPWLMPPTDPSCHVGFARLIHLRSEPEMRHKERNRLGSSTAVLKVTATDAPTLGAVISRLQIASLPIIASMWRCRCMNSASKPSRAVSIAPVTASSLG
jgi:hypothetical protein